MTYQKVDWYYTSQDGLIWWEMGKFVSDKKITLDVSYASVPERRDGTWEVSFLTPDKMIWKWVGGEYTETYVRIKEEVKDHETQSAPVALQKYDNIDEWIIALSKPDRDKWQKPEEVVMSLNLKPGDVVADIGAGNGYFTRYFTKAVSPGGKALGLDIDPWGVHFMMNDADMLESNIYEVRLIKPDNPELEPGSVDVVFLCNTYHHIENNRVDYFKRLSKSLKKHGRVVIVDYHSNPLPEFFSPDCNYVYKQVVLEEFREAGYKLTQDKDFLQYQYYLEFEL
jgi:predicted methyltransferase